MKDDCKQTAIKYKAKVTKTSTKGCEMSRIGRDKLHQYYGWFVGVEGVWDCSHYWPGNWGSDWWMWQRRSSKSDAACYQVSLNFCCSTYTLIETLYRENVSFRDRDLKRQIPCHTYDIHGIKPVRLNGSFDSKCTRPETSHSYQSFTILINTSTGINVALNNLRFKWHNNSRHQTGK